MQQLPTVSVIVVSWNAKNYLAQCLDTLKQASAGYPLEIFVVDNASSDGSPELVEDSYPEVRLIRTGSNLGFSKANNIGIKQSTGKYICLINSDVKVLEGCIPALVEFMESNPKVGLAGPRMLGPNGKIGRSCRGFPDVWNMSCHAIGLDSIFWKSRFFAGYTLRYWAQDTSRPVEILGGWFWITRREAIEQVGFLDEEFFFYAEDMDWCRRFHLKGWGVALVADAASIHFGGGSSKIAPVKYYVQEQRANRQYWRKHHSNLERAAYFGVCVVHQLVRLVGHGTLAPFSRHRDYHSYRASRSWHCLLWLLSRAD